MFLILSLIFSMACGLSGFTVWCGLRLRALSDVACALVRDSNPLLVVPAGGTANALGAGIWFA